MRAIFTEEVAQEIGYQIMWPEKKDWTLAIFGCLSAGVIFCAILCGILILTGNWDRQFQPNSCVKYSDFPVREVPAKCADYFGIKVS